MLTLLLIGMMTLAFNIQPVKAEPGTWTVDDDGPADFHTIQEALNAASPGDTIYVHNGTYYENVVVNKTVTLVGENKDATIIEGGREATAVNVIASNIVFRGFTTRVSGFWEAVNILLNETVNTVIIDNNIIGSGFSSGIRVYTSTNINLTGNSITVDGPGVVLLNSSHVLVTENNIAGLYSHPSAGIGLTKSFNNTVISNNLTEITGSAILLSESFNNTFAGNNITGWKHPLFGISGVGVQIRAYPGEVGSSYNTFYDNDIENTYWAVVSDLYMGGHHDNNVFLRNNITDSFYGIYLRRSFNFTFRDNALSGNLYGFTVYGDDLLHYIHDIDTSNTVNGKPVYYLTNEQDLAIDSSTFPNIGYLALINSTNIKVENLNLRDNGQGLLIVSTRNSLITKNGITNNYMGIFLDVLSYNNTIIGNNITNQKWWGVRSEYSYNNTLIRNVMSNNTVGVYLYGSYNNTLTRNTITNNSRGGVWLDYSFNNVLTSNNIENNSARALSDAGVSLYLSYVNRIFHNNFINNQRQAYTCPGNIWDDGYPSGGNYWSDYIAKGGYDSDGDGIGDIPYAIDAFNRDNYPLMKPWTPDPTEAIPELIETITNWNLPKGTENSLTSKLEDALHLLDIENEKGAIHKLMDFMSQVEALQGKKLTTLQADYLISEAQRIIELIKE